MRSKPKSKKNNKYEGLIVAGINSINQISEKSNNTNFNNIPIVCPPEESSILPKCLSYSVYFDHSVMVNSNSADSKGPNTGNINNKSQYKKISKFNRLTLSDNDNNFSIVSAVCGSCYTLYLLFSNQSNTPALAYFDESLKDSTPIFIDIQGRVPLALFGGRKTAAAIDNKGDVIIISQGVFTTPDYLSTIISLPNNEKSIYVACLEKVFYILSEEHKVYEYSLTDPEQNIHEVDELKDERIKTLSGTWQHVLAVTEDSRVFGRGSNEFGQLCQDTEDKLFDEFVNLTALNKKNIVSGYAGSFHSLFIDSNGKVLSCGKNTNGELLLNKTDTDPICKPTETLIKQGAKFCIAGCQISCVFCSLDPPQNAPNQQIQDFNINISEKLIFRSNSISDSNNSEMPEQDSNSDYSLLKSKLLKMKEELEEKNRFYDIIQNQNEGIIQRLQDLDQKIDQFVKSSKLEDNTPVIHKDEDENDNLVDEAVKGTTNPKDKNTQNKNTPKKVMNIKDHYNDDEKENKKTRNKKAKVLNNKIKPTINSNSESDDDNSEEEEKIKVQNKQMLNKKKTKQENIIEVSDDDDDDLDDDDKITKPNQKALNNNKKNKILAKKNDNNNNDYDGEKFKPQNKHLLNKKQTKQPAMINDDDDDDNMEEDEDDYTRDIKLNQQLYNSNKNDYSDDIDFQPPKRTNIKKTNNQKLQKPKKSKKVTFPKNKNAPAKKKPGANNKSDYNSDDDSEYEEKPDVQNKNVGKKTNKRQIAIEEEEDDDNGTMINHQLINNDKKKKFTKPKDSDDDNDDIEFQPPKRTNVKKPPKKAANSKKKALAKEYDEDDGIEFIDNPKRPKPAKINLANNALKKKKKTTT